MNPDSGLPLPHQVKLSPEAASLYETWHSQKTGQAWEREGLEQMLTPKLTTQVLHLVREPMINLTLIMTTVIRPTRLSMRCLHAEGY